MASIVWFSRLSCVSWAPMSDKLDEIMAWKRREIAPVVRPVTEAELARVHVALPTVPSFAAATTVAARPRIVFLGDSLTADQLAKAVTVESVRDTQLVTLRVRCQDEALSAVLANAIAEAVMEHLIEHKVRPVPAPKEKDLGHLAPMLLENEK